MKKYHQPVLLVSIAALFGFVFPLLAQTTPAEYKKLQWNKEFVGREVDLSGYKQTFVDDFNTMDVTAEGGGGTWVAPGHSTFGAGKFLLPRPDGPFLIDKGNLVLRANKTMKPDGSFSWTAACMQTYDPKTGRGFTQQYGYFEMRAKLPPGPGGWPGFWLLSSNGYLDKSKPRTEIDIMEWYGGDAKGLHTTCHLWPAANRTPEDPIQKEMGSGLYTHLTSVLKEGKLEGFHLYSAEVTPEWIIFYFDRKEVGRFPMIPEGKTPLYIVTDLAIFDREAKEAEGPKDMVVDYIAAYARPETER